MLFLQHVAAADKRFLLNKSLVAQGINRANLHVIVHEQKLHGKIKR
jgi:hypothetical protein